MINHQVSIPGVGNFFLEGKSASFDFINKVFHPSVTKINFSDDELAADKKFYSFVASEKNVNDVQAIQLFNEFAFNLKNNIHSENSVELPGLGTLLQGDSNIIKFIPIPLNSMYMQDVSAMPVMRNQKQEHFITVGNEQRSSTQQMQDYLEEEVEQQSVDRWWIFAIVLAIGGISAILFFYYKNGNLT